MKFDDLEQGISPEEAIEAFLDGCNRRDTLFAPETWRQPYVAALKRFLSNPITQDQAAALRSAALKETKLDAVISWLKSSPELPWEKYLKRPRSVAWDTRRE
ncbi:MAG: hypothetical protein ACREAC_31260, partial [Blastocatellia bacterium]